MKKAVQVVETGQTALESLVGEQITVFCLNYFYHGELKGVGEESILLSNPKIVFETGSYSDKGFKKSEDLKTQELYIKKSAIESFAVLENKND